ncbi:MAG: ABC transporter permease [Desulfitobacteriaceae bacterium]
MKPLLYSFRMFIRQIAKDSMLYAVCIAPLLAASFFRFGIPYLESLLCGYFERPFILSGYYLLFDLYLAVLTPFMFGFASSMVILTEYDENIVSYMAVTPVGKKGYIVSRLVFPALISFLVSVILMSFFSLTKWPLLMKLITCMLTSSLSIPVSLLIVSFSHNRVEGMALAKLSGIILLGLPVPFFLFSGVQYLFSILPSFWIAKFCREDNLLFLIPALLTLFGWLWFMYGRFEKKLA